MATTIAWSVLEPLLGGMVVGASAVAFLALAGRIVGVSGILAGLVRPRRADTAWRAFFVAGLIAGGVLLRALFADPFRGIDATPAAVIALAGVLVGFGASLGSGCTSGHGVCGVSRLSPRSIVATMTFMVAGGVTVFVARHVIGAWR